MLIPSSGVFPLLSLPSDVLRYLLVSGPSHVVADRCTQLLCREVCHRLASLIPKSADYLPPARKQPYLRPLRVVPLLLLAEAGHLSILMRMYGNAATERWAEGITMSLAERAAQCGHLKLVCN
jgi:hypothetical protein